MKYLNRLTASFLVLLSCLFALILWPFAAPVFIITGKDLTARFKFFK